MVARRPGFGGKPLAARSASQPRPLGWGEDGLQRPQSDGRAGASKGPLGFELARTPGPEIRGESLMDGFTPRARPRALLKLWQTQAAGRRCVYRSALTALSIRGDRAD